MSADGAVNVHCRVMDGNVADDNDLVQSDARSDGMFPLISNCKDLKPNEIHAAYKSQPRLEKSFDQLKTVQDLAPVWLKNVTRIEALMFLYYIAHLVHALIDVDEPLDLRISEPQLLRTHS